MRFQRLLKLAVSILEFTVVISVNSWRRAKRKRTNADQKTYRRARSLCSCRNVASFAHPFSAANSSRRGFPLTDENRQCKCNQRRSQRPFVALNWTPRQTYVHFSLLHFRQSFSLNLLHRAEPAFQMNIKPIGGLCDFAQTFVVQF